MRRAVGVVAVVAALAAGSWALAERDEIAERSTRLEEALDAANDRIAALAAARRASAEAAATTAQEAKRTSKRANALEGRLYGAKVDLQRLKPLAVALSQRGRKVFETRLLTGCDDDLLVVSWHDPGPATFSGIDVWSVSRENRSWELVYIAEPRPSFELDTPSYVLHGSPDAPVREEVEFVQLIDITDTGDANGDGLEDLAVQETGAGTGACGFVKLLRNTGTTLEEAYRHEGCNHGLSIERGHLVLGEAWRPKGCENIHGCGTRETWMRWDGGSWTATDVRRERY
jgi:hypothetical protein